MSEGHMLVLSPAGVGLKALIGSNHKGVKPRLSNPDPDSGKAGSECPVPENGGDRARGSQA